MKDLNEVLESLVVTRDGEVKNVLTGNWLKGDVNNCGYRRVQVFKKRFFIHRLVATVYIPNPLNLPQVNHINGNKKDNRVENLEWCSASENQNHKVRILGKTGGEKSVNAVLTNAQAARIRTRHEEGEFIRALAREYGVSQVCIQKIVRRQTYVY